MSKIFLRSTLAQYSIIPLLLVLCGASILIAKRYSTPIAKSKLSPVITLESAFGKENLVPVVVIGSGPAGLSAGIYSCRGGMRTILFEGDEPGGLLTKTTEVENWPGERSILGPNLIKKMHDQAKGLGVEFIQDLVEQIDVKSWPYRITTQDGKTLFAMAIVIATGANPKKLAVPGEEKYFGRGVSSCAICDAAFFKGKNVVIVGGGDSAVEQAFQLLPYVKSIKVLVRKESMRAAKTMQDRLKGQPNVTVVYSTQVKEVVGDGKTVTGVKVYNAKTSQETLVATDGVFLAIGHDPNTAFVKGVIPLDASGYMIMEGRTQHSLLEGIFAAGEVEDHRYKQAIVSAGRGASAALDALAFLGDIGYTPGLELTKTAPKPKAEAIHKPLAQKCVELRELSSVGDLDRVLHNTECAVLLDFYTKPCTLCKHLLPAIAQIQQEMQETLCVYKVDAEASEEIAARFDIHRVPSFVLIDGKGGIRRSDTIASKKELTDFITT